MATSEYCSCPPRLPTPTASHVAIASGVNHRVTSPRWTSARSYAGQFPTRYFVLYLGCTLDFTSRSCPFGRHDGQGRDEHLFPRTNALRRLAEQRESRVEEGHLLADHVHMMVSIPPKYSVAQVIGYIKGKSAIHIAREFAGRPRNFVGQHFWARGYYVSTVGRDERVVREYIQQQEREDRRLEQLKLEEGSHL